MRASFCKIIFQRGILFDLFSSGKKGSLQLIPFISLASLFDYPHMDNAKAIWGNFLLLYLQLKPAGILRSYSL